MSGIKDIATEQLVDELASRQNVKKIAVGPYANYSLREKFRSNPNEITCNTVLIINDSLNTSDNQTKHS